MGEIYAPNLRSAIFLQILDYVALSQDALENIRPTLLRFATDLKLIWPEKWSDLLLEISQREPITIQDFGPRQTLLSSDERTEIIEREIDYPEHRQGIRWMDIPESS